MLVVLTPLALVFGYAFFLPGHLRTEGRCADAVVVSPAP